MPVHEGHGRRCRRTDGVQPAQMVRAVQPSMYCLATAEVAGTGFSDISEHQCIEPTLLVVPQKDVYNTE